MSKKSKISKKVDHQCQVVHGRDKSEAKSSLKIDRHKASDPYMRDQTTGAYKHDTGNQYRVSQKTNTNSENNKILQVSEDLTIQLNFNGDDSIQVVPKYGMDYWLKYCRYIKCFQKYTVN
jgi:hypothetical protein